MRTGFSIILLICWCWPTINFSQSDTEKKWIWYEDFKTLSANWLGIGIEDENGSAHLTSSGQCAITAAEGSSMIIATEKPFDYKQDFEIHFRFRLTPANSSQDIPVNQLATFSWGYSFENNYQLGISFSFEGKTLIRQIEEDIKELVPLQNAPSFKSGRYNDLVIQKINDQYTFLLNQKLLASIPFEPFYGNGFVISAGSNLNLLIEHLMVANLLPVDALNLPPRIVWVSPEKTDKQLFTEQENLIVSGKVTDEDGIQDLIINGRSVAITENSFRSQVPLVIGRNIIKVIAIDKTEKKSTTYLEIIRQEAKDNFISSQKRLALIIGNANYQHATPLKNTINDAVDMTEVLNSLNFEVLTYENLDYQQMRKAIRTFSDQVDQFDVSLFFYAGHGIQVDGKNYLIPVDAKLDSKKDIAFEAIEVDKVLTILEHRDENSLNLLVLDACRNNPFRSWERGSGEGLSSITPPSGTLVAYSTSPGSFASDGYGDNGLYTSELIKQLNKSQRIEDVFINTRIAVEEKSGGNQSPWELARLRGVYFLK